MKNIILIGMPGSGKSTVGVVLAKIIGFGFLDSDLLIQEQEGRLLPEIMEEEGVDGFIEIENRVNREIEVENHVIATGGSVIYGEEAMEHLREIGTVVYLKWTLEEIAERLGDLKERGVVLKEGQGLSQLYEERCPLYERYNHITVECSEMSVEELAQKIIEAIK